MTTDEFVKRPINLGELTDEFDVILDLASSTLSDGSTVEAMRLARGVQAMESYIERQAARIKRLEEALRNIAFYGAPETPERFLARQALAEGDGNE